MASQSDSLFVNIVNDLFLGVGITLVCAGPVIVGYQFLKFFHEGVWLPMSLGWFWLSNGGHYPSARFMHIDTVSAWLFQWPMSAVVFLLGWILLGVRALRNRR